MQRLSSSQPMRRGFSLVEVLVVIAIIAVLAAISYPIASKMIKKSNIEKNRAIAMTVERGIEDFYDEYGYFPIDVGTDEELLQSQLVDMLNTLAGNTKDLNAKGKNFISSLADAANGRSGLVYGSGDNIDSLVTSFGGQFSIILDGTYDNQIKEPSRFGDTTVKGKRSLIWCFGEEADDENAIITTWQ
ncbi:MAG: prepilin-type N-terminal cleavage/methylation domain-containing protein [Rubritalea sp.]|uniref:prepilin-type N-terminal cleavage/methylation domain-containing protein n=1 Tax=Rubritalea sp. TaxID=2109375 RepID=UPI003242FE99